MNPSSSNQALPAPNIPPFTQSGKISNLASGLDMPRKNISCVPALNNQTGTPASSPCTVPALQPMSTTANTSQSRSFHVTPGRAANNPPKSISEKVAEARRKRREPSSIQRMFLRGSSRFGAGSRRTVLVLSSKGSHTRRGRVSLDALCMEKKPEDWNAPADVASRVCASVPADNPQIRSVRCRADSSENIRRGRSLFRSLMPKPRRHRARSPAPSRDDESTQATRPLRRRESVSPPARKKKGKSKTKRR